MKRPLAQHGAQTREILIKRIQHAEPVAAAVDFEAFKEVRRSFGLIYPASALGAIRSVLVSGCMIGARHAPL